jgi:hypothetical protein
VTFSTVNDLLIRCDLRARQREERAYAGKSENTHFEYPSFQFPSSAESTSASTYRSKDDAGILLTVCKGVGPLPSMGNRCPGSPCAQSWIHSLPGVSSAVPFSLPSLIPDMRSSSYADSSRGALDDEDKFTYSPELVPLASVEG